MAHRTLYLLALLLLPLYGFAEETLEQKIRNTLHDKTINEPYDRFTTANNVINTIKLSNLTFEEIMPIYADILLPYVEKEVKNTLKLNQARAHIYSQIALAFIWHKSDNTAQIENYFKKAIEYAEQSGNDTLTANVFVEFAQFNLQQGSIQVAHNYLYKAINLYETIGQYNKVTSCLYRIAVGLLQIRDVEGLRVVIEQMQQKIKKQFSANALYSLYAVQGVYYTILAENHPENAAFNDSALWVYRNNIRLIESRGDELPETVVFAWDYYNLAVVYDRVNPASYDSTSFFLNKALESKVRNTVANIEVKISVYTLYAELHFKQKNYEQAEKDMLYVLSLLEQTKDYNSVVVEFSEAYKFMVTFYETVNRPAEALKYQKLLTENEAKRYDSDKITTMNDMLVKYETEKKKEEIIHLEKQNKSAKQLLALTFCLIASLLITLLFFIRFYRLKKKNLEQSIYEKALFAELKQNELEENLKEKESLQKQYHNLENRARRDKEKADKYNEKLLQIKHQLEQKSSINLIRKLSDLISKSVMEKTKKHTYLQQLSTLDVEMLEQGCLAADEKISAMDMKYMACFAIEMDVKDMSLLFNIEPSSVYVVRYRIKKKFGGKNTFKFLI